MAEMTYIKFYIDDLESLEALTYEEKGRLYEAMLLYASTGEKPDLVGNERFVFPVMKTRIDRECEDMETRKEARKRAAQSRWDKAEKNTEKSNDMQSDANDANACNGMQSDANDAITIDKQQPTNDNRQTTTDKQQPTNDKSESKRTRTRFTPPTEKEVEDYCRENTLQVNAQRFVTFYASKGWKVGKESMRDWQAAVRGWALRDAQERQQAQDSKPKLMSSYSAEDIAAWERMEVGGNDLRGVG